MKWIVLFLALLFATDSAILAEFGRDLNGNTTNTFSNVIPMRDSTIGQDTHDLNFVWQPQTFLNFYSNPAKGNTLFVNFWATWCRPCVEEMPDLIAALDSLAIPAIFVSLDNPDNPELVQKFIQKQGWDARFILLDITDFDAFIQAMDPHWQGGIPMSILKYGKKYRSHYKKFNSQSEVLKFITL